VGVYVEDVIVTGASDEIITMFKLEMQQKFQMSDLGLLSSYLGIEVNQGPADITLCQATYRRKILEKCGMALCKSTAPPMENRLKLIKSSDEPMVNATEYRSIVSACCDIYCSLG
jgi:hypothetical protein